MLTNLPAAFAAPVPREPVAEYVYLRLRMYEEPVWTGRRTKKQREHCSLMDGLQALRHRLHNQYIPSRPGSTYRVNATAHWLDYFDVRPEPVMGIIHADMGPLPPAPQDYYFGLPGRKVSQAKKLFAAWAGPDHRWIRFASQRDALAFLASYGQFVEPI